MAIVNFISRIYDINTLYEPFKSKALELIDHMGDDMVVYETYRTHERQAKLLTIGASQIKVSAHQHHFAMDMVLSSRFMNPWMSSGEKKFRGHPQVKEADEIWKEYGAKAIELGLTWGGSWKMGDLVHVELKNWRKIVYG